MPDSVRGALFTSPSAEAPQSGVMMGTAVGARDLAVNTAPGFGRFAQPAVPEGGPPPTKMVCVEGVAEDVLGLFEASPRGQSTTNLGERR